MYEDIIATILGDLTPKPPPGQAMAGALRGQPTMPGGMPMMQPPAQPIPPPDLPPMAAQGPAQAAGAPDRGQGPPPPPPNTGSVGGSWGPPPQAPGGVSGTWGPPEGQGAPGAPPKALPLATGQRPAPGAPGGPGGAPGGPVPMQPPVQPPPPPSNEDKLQTEIDKLQALRDAAETTAANAYKPVDKAAMEDAYEKRSGGANRQLMLALAAQQAGEGFQPMQAHFLKQSAAAREPMKMRGGQLTAEGFIEDPDYATDLMIRKTEMQIRSYDTAIARAHGAQERARLQAEKNQFAKEQQERMQEFQRSQNEANRAAAAAQGEANRELRRDLSGNKPGAAGKTGAAMDPQTTLNYLDRADELLKSATGSGAGALVDQGAAFFGHGTAGAQAGAALKTTAAALTMQVPRMEGPQSDKDTAMYKEAAGNLGNESLPISTRQAAAKEMRRIANNYKTGYWAPPGYKAPKGWSVDGQGQGGGGALPQGWSVETR